MQNKNQRIAEKLQWMATNFRNIAVTMEDTIKILLEKDTVVATTRSPLFDELKGIPSTTLSDNAGRGTWGAALAASNRGDYAEVARIAAKSAENFKDAMTAEINENNRKAVEQAKATLARPNYAVVYSQTTDLTLIHRSPGRARYYKINYGYDRGAVIQVNDKTSKLIKDGRYQSIPQKGYPYVATVTCDNDGKDYVNRVLRPLLTKNQKIVRMYRPKGHAGHFTHCDVYVTYRHWHKP